MKTIKIIIFIFLCFSLHINYAQETPRIQELKTELIRLSKTTPNLNNEVELSVSNSSLKEFLRGIALANQLNITVAPDINYTITNNFSKAKVIDIFTYICQEYNLKIDIVGNIISFKKYKEPTPITKKKPKTDPDITYNKINQFLSLNLKKDTIDDVVRYITNISDKNVILSPKVKGKVISVFIKNRPFEDVLEKMALANGLKITKTTDGFYFVELEETKQTNNTSRKTIARKNANTKTNNQLELKIIDSLITIKAHEEAIKTIIGTVSKELQQNYFLYDVPSEKVNLFLTGVTYQEFLSYLLRDSEFAFRKEKEVYLIGKRNSESLRTTKLVELENRRLENVLEAIPEKLKEGVTISEFKELNGLILSGSSINIRELEEFIKIIDVVVPLITIDVIIADVTDSKTLSAGIKAGLGENPTGPTTGSISPGVDLNLSTDAINNTIQSINGLGIINLGNIAPNFYLNIKALEEDGVLKVKSTPTVVTLNSHEVSMIIGEEQYYLVVNNQIVNNQLNPNVYQSQQWKSVTADLSIIITPSVSKDEQITLDIKVEQSTFTSKVAETAPPGKTKRTFESVVRVKNNEMVLLGGLEENQKSSTTSGLPFLSRVPVIRWIFGTRSKTKKEKKLTIFIKPTVSYE